MVEPNDPEAFLTKEPLGLIQKGDYHQIPIIFGYNDIEGFSFKLFNNGLFGDNIFETHLPSLLGYDLNSPERKKIGERLKKFYCGDKILTTSQKQDVEYKVWVLSGIFV